MSVLCWLGANELCLGTPCVTEDQLKSLLPGSILGASTPANENGDEAAAGTPIAESVAPAALPAPEANHDTGVASSTSATPDVQQVPEDAVENPELTEPPPAPELEAANDNSPAEELPATGTE